MWWTGRSPHGECGLKSGNGCCDKGTEKSLPAWGVWIEISKARCMRWSIPTSLPAWGVWIEILGKWEKPYTIPSLPAWGVWIEMLRQCRTPTAHRCRSPHGECGLKFPALFLLPLFRQSLPAWGVWIEMPVVMSDDFMDKGRSPHGECGLK